MHVPQNWLPYQRPVAAHEAARYTNLLTVRSPVFRKLLLAAALLIAVALGTADFLLTRYTADRERTLAREELTQSLRVITPIV